MTVDVGAAHSWLDSVPGGALGQTFRSQWRELDGKDLPVITLYGAYDTGKSSLLRRIIIDLGGQAPDWLTISARHETFEVSEIEVGGCIIRDTPGFVSGGSDVRANANSEQAVGAVRLTDIGIVVLTPQLATAEFPALQELVKSGWSSGALWFVISRFDEAGIDPESDADGYRALAERKIKELRSALSLDGSVPVYVVCQDFAQMAGSERNLDKSFWSDSRDWDGMDDLERAIAEVGRSNWTALRDAAASRFWSQAVESTMTQLSGEAEGYEAHLRVCDESLELRESWLAQLSDLQTSAEADLRGKIGEAVGEAVYDAAAAGLFGETLKSTFDLWFRDQERRVDKLLQTVDVTIVAERARPSWQHLDAFLKSARNRGSTKTSPRGREEQIFAPAAKKVTDAVLSAFLARQKLQALKTGSAGASRRTYEKDVAGAVAVVIGEAASIAEKFYGRKVAQEELARERQRVEVELNRIGQLAATAALDELGPLFEQARESIEAATAEEVEIRQGVLDTVAELQACISAGKALLQPRTSP